MTVDTTELRARSKIIDPGLPLTAKAMTDAADELDALRRALAAVPHAELCRLLMTRDDEPCSCEKSAVPQVQVTGTATVRYPDVTRLEVHGPAGRVVGLFALTGALVDLQDDGRTLKVIYEQEAS